MFFCLSVCTAVCSDSFLFHWLSVCMAVCPDIFLSVCSDIRLAFCLYVQMFLSIPLDAQAVGVVVLVPGGGNMGKDRVKCTYYFGPGTVALVNQMQGELVIKTNMRVEKSELVEAAVVDYCRRRFPQIAVVAPARSSTGTS